MTHQIWKCLKCGHIWISRKPEKPGICPKCKLWKHIVELDATIK